MKSFTKGILNQDSAQETTGQTSPETDVRVVVCPSGSIRVAHEDRSWPKWKCTSSRPEKYACACSYGDMKPVSIFGKVVGSCCAIAGVLTIGTSPRELFRQPPHSRLPNAILFCSLSEATLTARTLSIQREFDL